MTTRHVRTRAVLVGTALSLLAVTGTPAWARPHRTLVYAALWGANVVTVSDAASFHQIKQIPAQGDGPSTLEETPDGRKVYVLNGGPTGRSIGVIDTRSNDLQQLVDLPVPVQADRSTKMPADGRYYYCSSIPDGKVVRIDTRTDQVNRVYPNGGADHSLSRDGKTLFVWGSTLTAIDTSTGATVSTLAIPTSGVPVVTAGIGWSVTTPDGASLIHVGNPTLFVDIRDRAHLKVVASVPTGASPILANPSPDGRWLWVPNADDGTISVIDIRQRRVVRTIVTGRYMTVTTFDPSGRRVYVAQATKDAPPPTRGTTLALYFAQMGAAGTVTPRTGYYQNRPGLDTPGEIVVYDARTFRQLPLPPIPQVTVPQFLSAVAVP